MLDETGVPRENQSVASHWQTLSHNVVSITSRHERALIAQVVVNPTTINPNQHLNLIGMDKDYKQYKQISLSGSKWYTYRINYLVFTDLVVYILICKGNKSGHGSMLGMPPLQIGFVKKNVQKSMHYKAKIKNSFVSCIRVTVRKCCIANIFCGIWRRLF